jgi:integrase/recombinase XerD
MRLAPPATPPYDPAPRPLIFLRGGMPIFNFHHLCKAVAKRAGLNPDHFLLHKFRATFATWHLWAGFDLRTVQAWMGHSDLESTMRYLKPNHNEAVRAKVEATFAA